MAGGSSNSPPNDGDAGSSNPPSDYEGKRTAVKNFRSGDASAGEKTWLLREGVNLKKAASEQEGKLEAVLAQAQIDKIQAQIDKIQAQIDKIQAQINVVESFVAEGVDNLTDSDKKYLRGKFINLDETASQQEAVKELVNELKAEKKQALERQASLEQKAQTPQVVDVDQLKEQVKGSLCVRHIKSTSALLEREKPREAVITHLTGALNRGSDVWDCEGTRSKVLAITGVKGCGKTTFMRHLAGGSDDNGDDSANLIESRVGGKAIMVSFNENTDANHMKDKTGEELVRSFAVHMLYYNKVPLEIAKKAASFDDVIVVLREHLGLKDNQPLTVLVDEIIRLTDGQAQDLITDLKALQDRSVDGSPVLFVFSTLTERYMMGRATLSNRAVVTVNLECFADEEAAFSLLPEDVQKCVNEHGALQALYHSLGGHPRAIRDGLARIPAKDLVSAVESSAEYALVEQKIINACNLNHVQPLIKKLDTVIPAWLSFDFEDPGEGYYSLKEEARLLGYLQRRGGTETLMPLLLRHYASTYASTAGSGALKSHLRGCYNADRDVWKGDNEKRAEALFLHWEMALKLANPGGATRGKFFAGAQAKDGAFLERKLTWLAPSEERVESFKVLAAAGLAAGKTLVSKDTNEPGVEYVTSFVCDEKQEAALVQVKFVASTLDWETVQNKMEECRAAENAAKRMNPWYIVYTTADKVPANMREGFLYFNRIGLMEYTAKLGPLKLLSAKLQDSHDSEEEAPAKKGGKKAAKKGVNDGNAKPPEARKAKQERSLGGQFAGRLKGQKKPQPANSVLCSWAPPGLATARGPLPAPQQVWLPQQLPLAVSPRNTVNLVMLRRARFAAKLFV